MSEKVHYTSYAEGLPPELAVHVHQDWFRNEAEYWAVRDSLIAQFENQWVAFANGAVIASHKRPSILHLDERLDALHAFVTCVGKEYSALRIRGNRGPFRSSSTLERVAP